MDEHLINGRNAALCCAIRSIALAIVATVAAVLTSVAFPQLIDRDDPSRGSSLFPEPRPFVASGRLIANIIRL